MIDHLLWAVPNLEAGIDRLEELSGVRAVHGGSHPGLGTHNALASLSGGGYLEILAADPAQSGGLRSFGRWLKDLNEPRLLTWAAPTNDAEGLATKALRLGLEPAAIVDLSRRRPDGGLFRARLLEIAGHRFGLALPFFVQRHSDSAHPSADAPTGIELVTFEIRHPEAEGLRRALAGLGLQVEVRSGDPPALLANLVTPRGTVVLK